MFNFKNSLAGLIAVSLSLCALAAVLSPTRGQINNSGGPPQFGPRRFYLTNTAHVGSQALTACAQGYHMASIWEILDPSNLRYDTELGNTTDDSGSGPPPIDGWIRTAFLFSPTVNCGTSLGPWTSASSSHSGTVVNLPSEWWNPTAATVISPWRANTLPCSGVNAVWCMQD